MNDVISYTDVPYETEASKPSIVERVIGFFQRIFGKREREQAPDFESYSMFRHFLDDMDANDPMFTPVKKAAGLCDDALKIVRQRMESSTRIHQLDSSLAELECFGNLSDDETHRLKQHLDRFLSLTRERNDLLDRLTAFDKNLYDLYKLEGEAQYALPQIEEAERTQRMLNRDLSVIHGERADLEYRFDGLSDGLLFIQRFIIGMVAAFVFVTLVLGYLLMFEGRDIFFPTTILVLSAMVIASLLYIFRRQVLHEMDVNVKRQSQAVSLLNKKNVIYAYYTNYLRFSYDKYKVRNSGMLRKRLHDFGNYKHVVNRIDAIRKIMYETENEIETIFREKQLNNIKTTIERFARTISLDDKKQVYKELLNEKAQIEKNLASLDERQAEIWDLLVELNECDYSKDKIIDRVIQAYLDEVSRILTMTA